MVLKVAVNCSQSLVHTYVYFIGQYCVQEGISYVSAVYVGGVGRLCYHQSGRNGHWYHRGLMWGVQRTWVSMKIWEMDHPLSFPPLPEAWCAILACWELIVSHMRLICTNLFTFIHSFHILWSFCYGNTFTVQRSTRPSVHWHCWD